MQTKISSFLESVSNTAVGFVFSLCIQSLIICPLFDLPLNAFENMGIVAIYTVAAIGRNYGIRRLFNKVCDL